MFLRKIFRFVILCYKIVASVIGNNYAATVQDDSDNITRFLILAREPIMPGTDRPFKVIAFRYLHDVKESEKVNDYICSTPFCYPRIVYALLIPDKHCILPGGRARSAF